MPFDGQTVGNQKKAAGGQKRAVRRRSPQRAKHQFLLPRVFSDFPSEPLPSFYPQATIRAAFEMTRKGRSGRMAVVRSLTSHPMEPSTLLRLAVDLYDNYLQPLRGEHWDKNKEGPIEWLTAGQGCTAKTGTVRDAVIAAYDALYGTVSVLLEVPVARPEDESALLALLQHIEWRVPRHQLERASRRFSAHVANRILGRAAASG